MMMRTRRDWLKYRSELFKYDPLIIAALDREGEFSVISRWSFFVIGAEDRIIAEVKFGWEGITAEESKPSIGELLVCLEDPGLEEIVQEQIESLFEGHPWLPALPIRFLDPSDYCQETRLPHLDGWYDPDTGKIQGSYHFFGDPLPYVEPEYASDVCKTCLRLQPNLEIRETVQSTTSIEARVHLEHNESSEDAISRIQEGIERFAKESIRVDYVHVEVIGAQYSLLLANECAEQIRQYCHEHYPEIEAHVIFV